MNYRDIANSILEKVRENSISSFSDVICDFNRGEIGMLSFLSNSEMIPTPGDLSEKLGVTTARIARILNSLEDKGCIKRYTDKNDKRKIFVKITNDGFRLVHDMHDKLIENISNIIEHLGEEETLEYLRISSKINSILNNSSNTDN